VPPGWELNVEEARVRAERAEGADAVVAIGAWDHATRRWRYLA